MLEKECDANDMNEYNVSSVILNLLRLRLRLMNLMKNEWIIEFFLMLVSQYLSMIWNQSIAIKITNCTTIIPLDDKDHPIFGTIPVWYSLVSHLASQIDWRIPSSNGKSQLNLFD